MNTQIKNIFMLAISLFLTVSLSAQDKKKKVETAEFKVKGVCMMCKERIENAALIKGVKLAEWDKETSLLKVVYNTKKTTLETIHKAVAEAGHETEKVKANEKAYSKLPKCCAYNDGVEKH
jgi:periplasmic mercuric ion binding protein